VITAEGTKTIQKIKVIRVKIFCVILAIFQGGIVGKLETRTLDKIKVLINTTE
jgi:CRISPR/Cas system CMR-associated protein Cmr3 (group 5 of RAMP superfamily)